MLYLNLALVRIFINRVKVLYREVKNTLKINGGLSAYCKGNWGLGCCSLAIKPLLHKLRRTLKGVSFPYCFFFFSRLFRWHSSSDWHEWRYWDHIKHPLLGGCPKGCSGEEVVKVFFWEMRQLWKTQRKKQLMNISNVILKDRKRLLPEVWYGGGVNHHHSIIFLA